MITSDGIGGQRFSRTMRNTIPQYAVAEIIVMTQVAIYAMLRVLVESRAPGPGSVRCLLGFDHLIGLHLVL
jgi:hypothetical protein